MRALPITLLALATTIGVGTMPASAADDVGPIAMDQPPLFANDTGGEWDGMVVSAGRSPQRADGVQLVGGCQIQHEFRPDTNDAVLVVGASATAASGLVTAYGHPVAVGVTCEVIDPSGQSDTLTVSGARPGVAVATGTAEYRYARPVRICVSMNATYSNNVNVFTETTCLSSDELVQ